MDTAINKSIKKPTLDHWFLIYQLKFLKKHFHIPTYVDVDVTRLAKHYDDLGVPAPYTTHLIKAASFLIEEEPIVNRAIFHTICGPKVVDFPYNSVNVPVSINRDGRYIVSATMIENAYKKTNREIRHELKKASRKTLDELPINKILHTKKNNWFNRLKLKLIHFTMRNFPSVYLKKKAGGISVSSILYQNDVDSPIQGVSFGMTGVTVFSCSLKSEGEKTYLRVGLGYDHMICHGEFSVRASTKFCQVLGAREDKYFNALTN